MMVDGPLMRGTCRDPEEMGFLVGLSVMPVSSVTKVKIE